ncbi:N-acetyltransferase [Rhizocola hellebori]|uniref:N-acetyltransferase n=1 Tax=Rhizocola hellebori TaxID=1392758 RepID=A0A8J3Q358_9ACTN|nr:GNAT family protein [Rhizocola hellebori]GIH02497.1 N-acetyltransferase [Rhizocola hellebori]
MPFAETPRLVIRRFQATDVAAFAAYRCDPEVARYQSWSPAMTMQEAAALVDEFATGDPDVPGWFQYAIAMRAADPVLIGDVGVHLHENMMQAEIGFTLNRQHQGHGYATEAVQAMLHHLFAYRRLKRVSAECDARNSASARLLQRVGFQREGLRRQHTWIKGEWTDDLLFGLLAAEFPSAP